MTIDHERTKPRDLMIAIAERASLLYERNHSIGYYILRLPEEQRRILSRLESRDISDIRMIWQSPSRIEP